MLSVSCLAVFGATGAITAERGTRPAPVAAARSNEGEPHAAEPTPKPEAAAKPAAKTSEAPAEGAKPEPTKPEAAARPAEAPTRPAVVATAPAKPPASAVPQGTVPPKAPAVGPEGNIAQRLDREAVGGSLKLKALGAAKTTQGDRAVLAIYVRMENVGSAAVKVDPQFFKLVDRAGTKYAISKVIEASLPAIELGPASAPGGSGQNTEGNLTFEIPKTAAGLALTYEPTDGAPMRVPLPPEFG